MAESVLAGEPGLIGSQAAESRLSPAEVHDLIRQRLRGLAALQGLNSVDMHRLARRMRGHLYAPGEIILPHGVHANCLGLVVRGQVAVHLGERGAARLVVVMLPGSTFGEAMLLQGRPSGATLQALTRCEIRFLHRVDLQDLSGKRRAEQRVTALRKLVVGSGVVFGILLAMALLLSFPFSRQAIALLPMSIGQWCYQRDLERCAKQAWQAAANLAPTDPNPPLALGTLHFERGEVAAAERAFETAKAIAPDSPEVHNNLGLLYARQGEHEQAIVAFRRALALEPGIAATEHNLAASLQAIEAYDEALAHYQSALALGQPQTSTLVSMAITYYEAGHLAEAEEVARQALRYDEALAPAHVVLGAVALESRQPEEALTRLRRAVALDATNTQAYFFLGLAYKSVDQPAEAIAAFENALTTADDEAMRVRVRQHLNELYEAEEENILQ